MSAQKTIRIGSNVNECTVNVCIGGDTIQANILRLRELLAGHDRNEVRVAIVPAIAKHYGCALNDDGTGLLKADPQYNTAYMRLKRIVASIVGAESHSRKTAPVVQRVSADARAAAEALLAICGGDLTKAKQILAKVAQ